MAGGLFGDAVKVPGGGYSYVTTTTETPQWMQDAIYNQIEWAKGQATRPYESYELPQVAELTPYQKQAYEKIAAQQGAWKPAFETAQAGIQSLAETPGGLAAAQPYLSKAGESSVSNISQYMNPYTQNVTEQIAKLGARNLSENLLPQVSDAFVKAGQFGGTRMGEFGSRALRDTQEAILNQQAQALQSGYGQALGASQADLARQAQLGSMAGTMTQADLARKQGVLSQMGQMAQQSQQMGTADTAALEAAGAAQQQNMQQQLTAAYNQWLESQNYPKQQLDWLSTQIRGMAPITPTTQYQAAQATPQSPLSQIASGIMSSAALYNLFNK